MATTPACPTCTVHQAKYTVGTHAELQQGYAITAADIEQVVDYQSHCPTEFHAPPCTHRATWDVMPAVAGRQYTETLQLATDHALGDQERATVELTLTRSGSPTLTKTETCTII